MGMPSFSDSKNIVVANRANFTIEFKKVATNLNILGKKFPATSVRVKGIEPQFKEWEIISGYSVTLYQGATPPTDIAINFIDNDKNELYHAIEKWAKSGKYNGASANPINLSARLPNASEAIIEVTEYASDAKTPTLITQYAILAPKDALDKELGDVSHKQYNVSFQVVGFEVIKK